MNVISTTLLSVFLVLLSTFVLFVVDSRGQSLVRCFSQLLLDKTEELGRIESKIVLTFFSSFCYLCVSLFRLH